MDDESFRRILRFFDLSWPGYRKVRKGVKKRLVRRMQELECRTVEDYLAVLLKDPAEADRSREILSVPISRFFRDRALWEVIGREIIPQLSRNPSSPVSVWSAGCACGEEVYSFQIAWREAAPGISGTPPLEITATDLNPVVLEKAQAGVYPRSSLQEVPPLLRELYFQAAGQGFAIRENLKQGIRWLVRDLISEDPPGSSFHLIFLRNSILTYYEDPGKTALLEKIAAVLRPGGFLIIGNNETVPPIQPSLASLPASRCILTRSVPVSGSSEV